MNKFNIFIIVIIFIIGLIFYCTNSRTSNIENFENKSETPHPPGNKIPKENCPNILMKKDDKIYLYNSNLARVPGINPIIFESLEEYVEFNKWQQSQNINCPVLFLDTTYDTQNNKVYKVTQNPFQQPDVTLDPNLFKNRNLAIHPLVNANRSPMLSPYNQDPSIPSDYDQANQYIGLTTPLDKMFVSKSSVSSNPMDPQWGGHQYTQAKVDEGVFVKDEIQNHKINLLGQTESIHNIKNNKGNVQYDKKEKILDNAMQNNWVGASQSELDVHKGFFKEDDVKI